jgi:hypothetical protein
MVSMEMLKNDSRFYIDDFNLKRIYSKKIISYSIKKIKVGDIIRYYEGKMYSLHNSVVYKFLESDMKDVELYRKYCEKNSENPNRTLEAFQCLVYKLTQEKYDITKGAIFIDNFNIIMEGQHRSCFLMWKYGPEYEVDVVKIKMRFRVRTTIKYILYRIKKLFNKEL